MVQPNKARQCDDASCVLLGSSRGRIHACGVLRLDMPRHDSQLPLDIVVESIQLRRKRLSKRARLCPGLLCKGREICDTLHHTPVSSIMVYVDA